MYLANIHFMLSKNLNIGIFTDDYFPSIDGAVTAIYTYTKEFFKLGHKVYIFAPRYPNYQDKEDYILRYFSIPAPFPPKYRLAIPYVPAIIKKVKELEINVIHSHSPFQMGWISTYVAKKLKLPAFMTYHTLYSEYAVNYMPWFPFPDLLRKYTQGLSRLACNKYDLVFSPSPQMKDALLQYGVKSRIDVLPTGVDIDSLQNPDGSSFRKEYGISNDEKVMLFMGRLGREKNVSMLIRAFERILQGIPASKLIVCGEGVDKPDLMNLAKELKISDKVIFPGFVTGQKRTNCYAAADVFTFTSLTETQGLVLLEAMALGKPVVAVGEMGVLDVLDKEKGGLLTKNNLDDFTQKVIRMLTDKALYMQKSEEAKKRAYEMSSFTIAEKQVEYYRELLYQKQG